MNASAAFSRRPVRIRSFARPGPIRRVSRWVPPPPGMMPSFTSVSASSAAGAATRRSHASESSVPPPSAAPFTAAMNTVSLFSIDRSVRRSPSRNARTSGSVIVARSLRSAPAQKAFSPAPVITTARTSRPPDTRATCCSSSASIARLIALRRPSPSIVHTSVAPRLSILNSAIWESLLGGRVD